MSVANITNRLKEIAKKMEELAKKEVVVGIPSGSKARKDNGGITNAELGMIHEFGSPDKGIPERSFIRSTFAEEADNIGQLMTVKVKGLLNNKGSVNDVYSVIGKYVKGRVVEKITDGQFTPNKDETLNRKLKRISKKKRKAKDANKPLIDTGQLRASITYEVRNES